MNAKLVNILKRAGYNKSISLVLAGGLGYGDKPFTSVDIQRITLLQQPPVSSAITHLSVRGWIVFKGTRKKEGVNRPEYEYQTDRAKVLTDIETDLRLKIKDYENIIGELKTAMILPKPVAGEQETVKPH